MTLQDHLKADDTHAIGLPALLAGAGNHTGKPSCQMMEVHHRYRQGRFFSGRHGLLSKNLQFY